MAEIRVAHVFKCSEETFWTKVFFDDEYNRRLPPDSPRGIEAAGAKSLSTKDALAFGPDLIHSVVNPSAKVTGAIHVYGGDFLAIERSEWDPDSLQERPYDMEKAIRMFSR